MSDLASASTDPLHLTNLISLMTQIISGALGCNFDASMWHLPEICKQADEINEHETEIFKVIVKKNGVRMTITPAVLRSIKAASDVIAEQRRQANLIGQAGKQMRTSYKCPFMMANCNGKSLKCARCKPLLGEWVYERKPKWPTCPFGIATCTFASRACAKCKQQQDEQ